MQDLRARRCGDLADPVTQLTIAVVTCHEHSPQSFTDVITAARPVLAIAELGSAGVDNAHYVEWASGAPATLEAMIEAAEAKDASGVWAAFSHPEFGLHRVAAACDGLPRWAAPDSAT